MRNETTDETSNDRKRIEGTRGISSKQAAKGMSRRGNETNTGQIATTEQRANTARSPLRPTRRYRREEDTGKSTTGKQAGDDARTSPDQESGGIYEARKQERAGGRGAAGRKERKDIASLRSR